MVGLLLGLVQTWTAALASFTLDPDFQPAFTTTHGAVLFALGIQPDGRIVMSGDFAIVQGQPRRGLARLQADGSLDPSLDLGEGVDGLIYTLAVQPGDGRILVGGQFQTCRGSPRSALARLDSDGNLDLSFAPVFSGPAGWFVTSIVLQPDGRILVGGSFDRVDGVARSGLVRLLPSGTVDPDFQTGTGLAGGAAYEIVVQPDGRILVGGGFTHVGGLPQAGLVRLEPDGRPEASFRCRIRHLAGSGKVYAIAVDPDRGIVIGGSFDQVGDLARAGLARLRHDGNVDPGFEPRGGLAGAAGTPFDLATLKDGTVIVTGSFSHADGLERVGVARLDPAGEADEASNPGSGLAAEGEAFGNVLATQRDGRVLVAGQFDEIGGVRRHCVAQLLADGTVDPNFSSAGTFLEFPGSVHAVAPLPSGGALVGGDFGRVNGEPRHGLARLDAKGALVEGFDARLEPHAVIHALAVQPEERFLIGGWFRSVGEAERPHFARVLRNGRPDPGFALHEPEASVRAIALLPDQRIIVAGEFRQFGNLRRFGMVRLGPDGEPDESFDPRFEIGWDRAAVLALALQPDGALLVGGYFDTVSGQPRAALARVHLDGALDTGFNASIESVDAPPFVDSLVLREDGRLVIGGGFHRIEGRPRQGLARLYADGQLDASFDPDPGIGGRPEARVEALALLADGRIAVGGDFERYGPEPYPYLALLSNLGSPSPALSAWGAPEGPIHAIALQPDGAVLIGGTFVRAFGRTRLGLARVTAGKAVPARGLAITARGDDVRVHWDGGGRLLQANDISGPWREILPASSPHVPPRQPGAGFYRLVD